MIGSQPPKNKMAQRELIKSIFAYSPKKKRANVIAEYSTLYPETSSASASGKSKGCLLVSASITIQKTRNIGNKGTINQIFCCIKTISVKLNEPAQTTTFRITKPNDNS